MTTPVVLSWFVLALAWGASFLALRVRRLDAAFLFLLLFGVLIVFRSTVLSLGFDGPFPDEHFQFTAKTERALTRLNLIGALWLGATCVGFWVGRTAPQATLPLPFRHGRGLSSARHQTVLIGLTVVSVVVVGVMLSRSGGLGGAIAAQKFERSAGSSLRIRSLGVVTSSVAMAFFLRKRFPHLPRLPTAATADVRSSVAPLGVIGLVVGALAAFVWGARDGAAFPVVAGVLFWSMNSEPRRSEAAARRWRRLAAGGAAVAGVVVGLRVARDMLAKGEVESSIGDQEWLRQVSVAANLTQFDAAMLTVRDWPLHVPHSGFSGLFSGFLNYVPRSFGGPESRIPNAASELANRYEPQRTNGWPLTALGEWWMASGWAGVVVGGIVCGLVISVLHRHYPDSATDPLQLMMLVLLTVVVFQFGLRGVTFSRVMTIVVPLLLIDLASGWRPGRPSATEPVSSPVPARRGYV